MQMRQGSNHAPMSAAAIGPEGAGMGSHARASRSASTRHARPREASSCGRCASRLRRSRRRHFGGTRLVVGNSARLATTSDLRSFSATRRRGDAIMTLSRHRVGTIVRFTRSRSTSESNNTARNLTMTAAPHPWHGACHRQAWSGFGCTARADGRMAAGGKPSAMKQIPRHTESVGQGIDEVQRRRGDGGLRERESSPITAFAGAGGGRPCPR